MKFKVGDKVKFVKSVCFHTNDVKIGETYTIVYIDEFKGIYQVENGEWFKEKELTLPDYTYEDLKKSPIGTKVTFKNGAVLVKDNPEQFENSSTIKDLSDLKNLESTFLGKIIKIEEPEYRTVYEAKPEILDEVEKRYLRNFLTPFRDDIETIRKLYSPTKEKEYIQIRYKNDRPTNFPYFESNAMYKGMELNKHYTLEELGL